MLSERDFENKVWDKYNKNKDDLKDYNKKFNCSDTKINLTRIAAICTLALIGTSSLIYVGAITYEKYLQKTSSTRYEYTGLANEKYKYLGMKYQNEFYYKKINNYKDYMKCKEKLSGLIDIKESDFENYFMIIILSENTDIPGIKITQITNDEKTLYIEVDKNSNEDYINNNKYLVSSMVSKENEKENIVINKKIYNTSSSNYVDIKALPKEYNKENALIDNCLVVENNIIADSDKEKLFKFINNTKNKNEDFIRIVKYEKDKNNQTSVTIIDLQYKENRYLVCIDYTRNTVKNEENDYYYSNYNDISTRYSNNLRETLVELEDSLNQRLTILIYK